MTHKKNTLLLLLLPIFLLLVAISIPHALAEGTGENSDNDTPSVVDIGEGVYNILVPVSGYETYGRSYAVALSETNDFNTNNTDGTIAKVWQDYDGTTKWTYIVGESEGSTTFQLDGHTYTVRVVPRQEGNNASVKHIKISAQNYDPDKVTIYYSINGSELYKADPSKVDIDQDFVGGFNITIFAASKDGYALTRLRADAGEGLFYSLSGEKEDGTDSMAWPFEDLDADDLSYTKKRDPFKGSGYQHSFGGFLDEKNMSVNDLRDLYKRAKSIGCEGVLTYTRNSTGGLEAHISCEIVPLPTMTKTIVGYKPKGQTAATDEWITTLPAQLEIGDQLKYAFTITGSGSTDIDFSNIVLKDEMIGFATNYTSANLQSKDGFVAYAEYTIKTDDIAKYTGGKFTNSATLHYTYASKYSKGTKNVSKSSSVSCDIKNLITFDWCEHTPDAIKNDKVNFPVPNGFEVQLGTEFTLPTPKNTEYIVYQDGYVVGTWKFIGYCYVRGEVSAENYEAGDTLTFMDADMNATFKGHWKYEEARKYSVTLEWTGLPENSDEKVPTHTTEYYAGQSFNVDSFYQKGMIIEISGKEYIFTGWKLAETDSTTISGLQKMKEGGITLYGEWNPLGKQTTLTITVTGSEGIDENQTYLFRVTGDDVDLTVSVHGNSSVTIYGVLSTQTYTVTPVSGWSWRYKALDAKPITIAEDGSTVTFQQVRTTSKWLDGNAFSNLFNNRKEDD